MKKVGIMTMHRIVNYGSFLQAYCLKKEIERTGSTVEFVDYKFDSQLEGIEERKNFIWKLIEHKNIFNYIKYKKHAKKFKNKYDDYLKQYLNVSSNMNYNYNLDSLVIGSDEVFNCMQPYPVGYSKNLFGFGYEKINVISYAASFGNTTYKKLFEYKIDKEIGNMLSKFKSISVRDINSFVIVKKLIKINPKVHFDPVLIGDFSKEINEIDNIKLSNYIVVYAYPNRLLKEEKKYIKKFAKKYNKIIVSLGFYQDIADYNLIVNPFLALKYIKRADYVITDTFHGTVFSIKMNTKFCTIIRNSNYNKLNSLLEELKHLNQEVINLDNIKKIYLENISFEESNRIIESETENTKKYLMHNV